MSYQATTRVSLLMRVHNAEDHTAWSDFVSLYRPMIYRFGRERGLQPADAQDLAQSVLASVSQQISDFQPDPGRARFRTWLARVASNQAITMYRRRKADSARGGTTMVEFLSQQSAPGDDVSELQRQFQRELFRRAAHIVRQEFEESTWQAFWMTAVENIDAANAARSLSRSVGSVYTARSRVIRRLKEVVQILEPEGDSLCVPDDLEDDQ